MNRRQFHQSLACLALGNAFEGFAFAMPPASGPFRFSVMLWTIESKQQPFECCLEIVAEAGYQGAELVEEFRKWSPEELRRMKARASSLGLVFDTMAGIRTGFADPMACDTLVKEFTALIPIAKELDCLQVILLSGPKVDGLPREVQYKASVENLKRVTDVAASHGLKLVIEPIDPIENPPIWLTSVADGFRIVREVNNPTLKVLYDFYHEQRAAGNLIEKLEQNSEWVGLVHIADVPGRHDPGTGEIDYRNIYRKLAELKYGGFVAMEYYPIGDPASSLKKARLEAVQAARG